MTTTVNLRRAAGFGCAMLLFAAGAPAAAAPATPAPAPVDPGTAAAAPADGRFSWPLAPEPPVVRPFEPPPDPYGPGHRGVDLGARPGQPVLAAGAGVVVFAGRLAGRGVVSIDHDVLRTTYEPIRPTVSAGDQVYAGQRIGTVEPGHPECAAQAPMDRCLHWGVRRDEEYLNPLTLVADDGRIRLKPWRGT